MPENNTIGKALCNYHAEGKKKDTSDSKMAPLEYCLKLWHKEYHVNLCARLGIEPLGLGQWLRTKTENINKKP